MTTTKLVLACGALALALVPRTARADDRGWILIGERSLEGPHDSEVIRLDGRGGRFARLAVRVRDEDVRITEMTIGLGNGDSYRAPVRDAILRVGAVPGVIALPDGARAIDSIRIDTERIAAEGRHWRRAGTPRLEVWALPARDAAYGFGALLGHGVAGRAKGVVVIAPAAAARDARLTVTSPDPNVELTRVKLVYDSGKAETLAPDADQVARAGGLDLGPRRRGIKSIRVEYRNFGRRAAPIDVYARR